MFRRFTAFSVIMCLFIFSQSCSGRAWYEGMKESRRAECNRIESPSERRECLEEVDEMSYDRYEKDRNDSGR